MLKVKILSKSEIINFIGENFSPDRTKNAVIQTSAHEIINFFSDVDKDEWVVIDYFGSDKDLKAHLSLLSVNIMLKSVIEATLPETYPLEGALELLGTIKDRNLCKDTDSIICINTNSILQSDEIACRLIVPKYTYNDMWNKSRGSDFLFGI